MCVYCFMYYKGVFFFDLFIVVGDMSDFVWYAYCNHESWISCGISSLKHQISMGQP